jgi:hypothetical protein
VVVLEVGDVGHEAALVDEVLGGLGLLQEEVALVEQPRDLELVRRRRKRPPQVLLPVRALLTRRCIASAPERRRREEEETHVHDFLHVDRAIGPA